MEIIDRFTNLEYGKVRYSITGEASDNLVVLMHGLTTSKDIYNNLTQDLIEQGFQVLSFDFYGRGKSDYVPNVASENLYVNQANELCNKLAPIMNDGGAILNISSTLGLRAMEGAVAYCAAKGGVVNLTKAVALDLVDKIRVNCLCPGVVETPYTFAANI